MNRPPRAAGTPAAASSRVTAPKDEALRPAFAKWTARLRRVHHGKWTARLRRVHHGTARQLLGAAIGSDYSSPPADPGEAAMRKIVAAVPGWLGPREQTALYALARAISGRGVIVEIGSWLGKSTICLALGSRAGAGASVYAIDPFAAARGIDTYLEGAGVSDIVKLISACSQAGDLVAAFSDPVELLFIDGSHTFADVRDDFDLWVPKLVEGGFVAMHDTTWSRGPRLVARESIYRSFRFGEARYVPRSLTIARKVRQVPLGGRLRNRSVMARQASLAAAGSALRQGRRLLYAADAYSSDPSRASGRD
jgi:MMP 1-O-methyltransferase